MKGEWEGGRVEGRRRDTTCFGVVSTLELGNFAIVKRGQKTFAPFKRGRGSKMFPSRDFSSL